MNNYRPFSNLPLLRKILNICFNVFQSRFHPHHSPETILDINLNTDSGIILDLVLLDLSAAFTTVNHNMLQDNWVELSGIVQN